MLFKLPLFVWKTQKIWSAGYPERKRLSFKQFSGEGRKPFGIALALLFCALWLVQKNLPRYFINQSDLKLSPIGSCSTSFSRASCKWLVFALSSHWKKKKFLWTIRKVKRWLYNCENNSDKATGCYCSWIMLFRCPRFYNRVHPSRCHDQ